MTHPKTLPNDLVNQGMKVEYLSEQWSAGLTKREFFAAMAMQGMLSSGKWSFLEDNRYSVEHEALKAADALIAELSKEKK